MKFKGQWNKQQWFWCVVKECCSGAEREGRYIESRKDWDPQDVEEGT